MDSNAKFKTPNAKLQRIVSFLCMISCIICSNSDLFKMIYCYINNQPTFTVEITNVISDIFLYISSILLYIRLIYFQLHVPFSESMYSYSSKSLCFASIPIFISFVSMVLYEYGMIKYIDNYEKQDDYVQPYLITIMVMDSLLNIITLYLFTKQLRRLILDTPYDDVAIRNDSVHSDTKRARDTTDILSEVWKFTFTGTHAIATVALIARYSTLSITAIIGNQCYFITMGFWVFLWKSSNIMGYIVFTVRVITNFISVLVQYLLFYRYTKSVYHLLCSRLDRVCFGCCMNRIKTKYKTNVSTQIDHGLKLKYQILK